ncbi:nuclear transport factor 2 family protein [Hydrogenophaga sp.]|uniref:nuclear transport factor 2 family protein n=1 Tax=Hydrogenophaga sp. TaxID=1904254 RepID=UPI0027173D6B|nr:nuclear transport factor 2 family protein [Hydrogenophaga sp.]MDO9438652.1 nuclear transport factor 2 family protein [Hydrogenophaga sp.]
MSQTLDPQDTARIEAAIERLNVDYWFDVDRHEGLAAHDFYTDDGVFTTSIRSRTGREAIAAFYRGRQDGRVRTARHVISNLRIDVQDAEHASADWILLLYAADGAPVLPSESAIMIADVHDECVRGADGRWRYSSRTIVPVFKSATPTTG